MICILCILRYKKGAVRELSDVEKRDALQQALEKNFPYVKFIIDLIIGVALSLSLVVIGAMSIHLQSKFYYVGIGIWVGAISLFIDLLAIYLIIAKSVRAFYVVFYAKLVAYFFLFAMIIHNILSRVYCPTSSCPESDDAWVGFTLMAIGMVIKIENSVSLFFMLFYMVRSFNSFYQFKKKGPSALSGFDVLENSLSTINSTLSAGFVIKETEKPKRHQKSASVVSTESKRPVSFQM